MVQSCRTALADTLEEPVLGACPFSHTGSMTRKLASEHLGLIPGMIAKLVSKKRAGGLPSRLVLVITPTSVRAYPTTGKYTSELDPTEELAGWPRASLSVAIAPVGMFTKVTLAPADGEPIAIQAVNHASTDAFIALHQNRATR